MFAKIKAEFSNAPVSTFETSLKIVASLVAGVGSLFYFFSDLTDEVDVRNDKVELPIVAPEIKSELTKELKGYQEFVEQKPDSKSNDWIEGPRNYIELTDFVDIKSNFFELGIDDDAYNLIDGNINTTVKFPSQKRTLQAKFSLAFAKPIDIQYIGIGLPSSDYQLNLSRIKIRAQYANDRWGEWVEYKIESSSGEARLNFSSSLQVSALEFNPISSVNKFREMELGDVSVYQY